MNTEYSQNENKISFRTISWPSTRTNAFANTSHRMWTNWSCHSICYSNSIPFFFSHVKCKWMQIAFSAMRIVVIIALHIYLEWFLVEICVSFTSVAQLLSTNYYLLTNQSDSHSLARLWLFFHTSSVLLFLKTNLKNQIVLESVWHSHQRGDSARRTFSIPRHTHAWCIPNALDEWWDRMKEFYLIRRNNRSKEIQTMRGSTQKHLFVFVFVLRCESEQRRRREWDRR